MKVTASQGKIGGEVSLRLTRLVILGWVIVFGVQLPVRENLSQHITNHPGQLNLAIPSWVGAMSTSDGYGHPREENGEFCITVVPVTRTAGI